MEKRTTTYNMMTPGTHLIIYETLYLKAISAFISLFEESEEKFGYKYMLVDGVLTSIYAEARQTQDVDILI